MDGEMTDGEVTFGGPAAIADAGRVVAVVDHAGHLGFLGWPDGPWRVVSAHQNPGPVAAVGADVATSGGWETAVTRWDVTTGQPRWTIEPFDGRVTAMCGQGGDLLVAGANRAPDPSGGRTGDDSVALGPGAVLRIDEAGRVVGSEHSAVGSVRALAAAAGMIALVDDGVPTEVMILGAGGSPAIAMGGPVRAIGAHGDVLAVADDHCVEVHDLARGQRSARFAHAGEQRILAIAPVGDGAVAIVGTGFLTWPGAEIEPAEVVDIASRGDVYLALRHDAIELRASDGTVLRIVALA